MQIHAQYTRIAFFWHISNSQSQICYDTSMFYLATSFLKNAYTTDSWLTGLLAYKLICIVRAAHR